MSAGQLTLDHVALLVRSLEPVLERLVESGLAAGPVESFPSEGTREVYLGDPERPGRLLLLESTAPGPYQRALDKRGPGLHHVALAVPDLDAFANQARGWLLHPHSLESRNTANTLWFARPGVGTLLEVTVGGTISGPPQLSVGVSLSDDLLAPLLDFAGLQGLEAAPAGGAWIRAGSGEQIPLAELAG